MLALEGLRVIDLTTVWAGPLGTQFLGDLGAEVIKVESCAYPDMLRGFAAPPSKPGERFWDRGGYFHTLNRNKYGVTLDLRDDLGKRAFRALVRIADVVIENFSLRVMRNLGLDYLALRAVKPDLIMVSMPGYGASGPYKDYPAWGETIDPTSGLASITGYLDGPPMRSGVAYGDPIAGVYAALAVLMAAYQRRRTGEGQYVDVSHLEGLIRLLGEAVMDYSMNGRVWGRLGNRHLLMVPHGCYRCRGEDRWIAIAVASDQEWSSFCGAIGQPEWTRDARFVTSAGRLANEDELDRLIESWTRQRDHREATRVLQEAGVAAGAVLTAEDLCHDPHIVARGIVQQVAHCETGPGLLPGTTIKLSRTPGGIRKAAPCLGEDNEYVLGELVGMSAEDVAELADRGVIGTAPLDTGRT
ncbi:MAG: CoA transferase [Chloroflexi bacterium]|nr:CoA transferase [Chloroflexota bacterium]